MSNERFAVILTGLSTTGLQTHIVRHDLSPLHVGQGELWVWDIFFTENNERNQSGVWQILSGDGSGWAGDAISVLWSEQTTVRAVWSTPGWVLQIIAGAIEGTVAGLGAHWWSWTLGGLVVGAQEWNGIFGLWSDQWAAERNE